MTQPNEPEDKNEEIQELLSKLKAGTMEDDEWRRFVDLTHDKDERTEDK